MSYENSLAVLEPQSGYTHVVPPDKPPVTCRKMHILLIEDVYSDAILTQVALNATGIPHTLSRVKRGDEALSRLQRYQHSSREELPDLILLDLGLPGMDGFEILAELTQMPHVIRSIPLAILTVHENFEYIQSSYLLPIMDYISKPCGAAAMKSLLTRIGNR